MNTAFLVAAVAILSIASAQNDSFDKRCLRACPYDYRPVCASNGQNYRVFPNECTLAAENCDAGYKHQHLWVNSPLRMCVSVYSAELNDPVPCPKNYWPVCGFDGKTYKIFDNTCLLKGQQNEDGQKWARTHMDLCLLQIFQTDPVIAKKCIKGCDFDYRPVCGFDGVNYMTAGNPCQMDVLNCGSNYRFTTISKGRCPPSTDIN